MTPLLAKFRVYPRGRWHFFEVYVWARRRDMHKALRLGCVDPGDCEAICCASKVLRVRKGGKWRATGQLGQIHFYRGSFAMGTITHEAGHAALAWANVKGIDPGRRDGTGNASEEEEAFCWVLGNIARQIVLKTARQWDFDGATVQSGGYC